MRITLSDKELELLEFRISPTSDRQDQPVNLADSTKNRKLNRDTWMLHRWDMFYVDVLLRLSHLNEGISIRTELNGRETFSGTGATWLKLARFFVEPNLQNPSQLSLTRQPNFLDDSSLTGVERRTMNWFFATAEYTQQVEWVVSAMNKMREILVLAGEFDADWWSKFQENVDNM